MRNIEILGISGSLRRDSTNTTILKTFGSLLPPDVHFEIFHGLDKIPHFSPGISHSLHVTRFERAIQDADGVVICTPEYAFGVPGTLKNALDWTVASGNFNNKPVSAIAASPLNSGGKNALASLLLTLTALGTKSNQGSSLSIANVSQKIVDGIVAEKMLLAQLQLQCENLLTLVDVKPIHLRKE